MPTSPQLIQYGVTAAVILLVLVLRTRALRRERPLKLEQLWIVPTLYGAIALYMIWKQPPAGAAWGAMALALIAGAAIGWWRGKQMTIIVDPVTHRLNQRGSPLAIAVLVLIVLLRAAVSVAVRGGMIHMDVATLTDMLVVFALGLFSATRIEMFLRARRLLDDTRARA